MIERDLQEWEEYDARLLDDAPAAQGAGAAQRSGRESLQAPLERAGEFESPFLLGNAGQMEAETEGMEWERSSRTSSPRRPKFRIARTAPPQSPRCSCACGGSTDDSACSDADEYGGAVGMGEQEPRAPNGASSQESLVDDADGRVGSGESLEIDPYYTIRSAMSPEHSSLQAGEVTAALGRAPVTLVLHQLLNSPEVRQATLASLLGNTGRRLVQLNGFDVSIPAYFRLISRLCREVAEQGEVESRAFSWESPPVCPLRDPGEKTKSFFATPKVTFSKSDRELLIQGFPIGSKSVTDEVTGSPAWQEAMSFMAGDPNVDVAVFGFSDCAGKEPENFNLQQQRADEVKARMPPEVRSRVRGTLPAGTASFLAGNSTANERALNRAVRVRFLSTVRKGEGPFDRLAAKVAKKPQVILTIDEYLFLVRSLEQALGLSAPQDAAKVLSVLRQIYYGSASWTLASGRNPLFNLLITSSPWPASIDPEPLLAPPPKPHPLMEALRKSQTVETLRKGQTLEFTDIGHVLAGLDAMMNPHPVSFHGITTSLNNEEVASWLGDVGSAAAEWAVDNYYGLTVGGKPASSQDHYFSGLAGDSDLLGDIDAYAMRAAFSPSSSPSSLVMSAVTLRGALSDALLEYYRVAQSNQGKARNQRFRIFVESFGGVIRGGSLVDPQALITTLQPKVVQCALALALMKNWPEHQAKFGERKVPPGDRRELNELVVSGSAQMTNRFVTFLTRRL